MADMTEGFTSFDMSSIFDGCINLEEINFNNNFITDKVNDMSRMFFECSSLTKLDLSNFNTGNVINMEGMFEGCSSLKELNLTNFNTENVTSMLRMFFKCSSLVKLNLNSFIRKSISCFSFSSPGLLYRTRPPFGWACGERLPVGRQQTA